MREPDWEALGELQFILYNRIAGALAEALSSIALSNTPEAQDKPPGYWQDRASDRVGNMLNLFTAWSTLIEYKLDRATVERAIRPFRLNRLLEWLAQQLQLSPAPRLASDPLLHANQETLQEALLLLYSAAYAYGANARLELEASKDGVWFHLKFKRHAPLPAAFDDLLSGSGEHWRARQTIFELAMARDFIRLNGGDIVLGASATHGAFMFFIRAAGVPPHQPPPLPTKALQPAANSGARAPDMGAAPIPEQTAFGRLTPALARLLSGRARTGSDTAGAPVETMHIEQEADTPLVPDDAARRASDAQPAARHDPTPNRSSHTNQE